MRDQWQHVPDDHSVRLLFSNLTQRGMGQTDIQDAESISYISNLMVQFIHADDLYPMRDQEGHRLERLADMVAWVNETDDPDLRLDRHRYLGDLTLFMLGLFPERFNNKRVASAGYYAAQGRKAYGTVAELTQLRFELALYRRLADSFERYVKGLNWVKLYIHDPFFQYMFREFSIS